MKDIIVKGTGNSRYLKSAIDESVTWEQFRDMLIAGTAPIDLNGINEEGFLEQGTPLGKETLLSDCSEGIGGMTALSEENKTPDVRTIFASLEFKAGETVFNEDGSITETYSDGSTKSTVFASDGPITETLSLSDGRSFRKTTVFQEDGSISERIEEVQP